MLLSVVVPCCDEEAVIGETHRRLVATLGACAVENIATAQHAHTLLETTYFPRRRLLEPVPELDFELVYVDDGSRDGTLNLLRELQRADVRVRVLALSRNFGHEIAVTAGLKYAGGDAVVLIDADLQDPPEVIPEMLERWRCGADVAYGVRIERDGETRFKRWTASAFYGLLNRLADISIPLDTGGFRLMDRKVVDAFLAMPERDRFTRAMVAWIGFRQEPVHYRRAARAAGETKYPFGKMLHLAIDGIVSFSFVPLRLATLSGFLVSGLALAGIVYVLVLRLLTAAWVSGWASLLVAVLFLGGVQLICLGILGAYLGRIYGEVKRRPLYLVKERLGFPPTGRRAVQDEPADE